MIFQNSTLVHHYLLQIDLDIIVKLSRVVSDFKKIETMLDKILLMITLFKMYNNSSLNYNMCVRNLL